MLLAQRLGHRHVRTLPKTRLLLVAVGHDASYLRELGVTVPRSPERHLNALEPMLAGQQELSAADGARAQRGSIVDRPWPLAL
eukprot:9479733-Pyramimonas_sp.AAC.1